MLYMVVFQRLADVTIWWNLTWLNFHPNSKSHTWDIIFSGQSTIMCPHSLNEWSSPESYFLLNCFSAVQLVLSEYHTWTIHLFLSSHILYRLWSLQNRRGKRSRLGNGRVMRAGVESNSQSCYMIGHKGGKAMRLYQIIKSHVVIILQ